jgi:outer membrane protein assembly factor BamB
MRTSNGPIRTVVSCMVLVIGNWVCAQDWPQWRGANRDDKVAGFAAPQTWPKELALKWKVTVGPGDATPALVGDNLYVFTRQGADEVIACLNAADGKQRWQDKYAARPVTGPAARHPGPRSSPTVADGKVITLGASGVLSCLNAETGAPIWRKDVFPNAVPQFFTAMSPIVVDGKCIAHLGGKDKGAVIAFDLASGDQKWQWEGDGPAYASPVLMTADGAKQVVVQTTKNLVGLAVADGKLLWQIPTVPQGRFWNSATPIVDGQTVIYTGQGKGTRAVRIEKQGDGFAAKELWCNEELGTTYNTPVLKDGLLFGLSDRGNLFCIDAKTGRTAWKDSARRENFGAVLDVGRVLLALPSTSELVAYKPDGKAFAEVAKYKVAETPVYAHPVLSGKRVFVKDQESLALLMIE